MNVAIPARAIHRIAGAGLVLPLVLWIGTGFLFHVKPGWDEAYESARGAAARAAAVGAGRLLPGGGEGARAPRRGPRRPRGAPFGPRRLVRAQGRAGGGGRRDERRPDSARERRRRARLRPGGDLRVAPRRELRDDPLCRAHGAPFVPHGNGRPRVPLPHLGREARPRRPRHGRGEPERNARTTGSTSSTGSTTCSGHPGRR